MVKVHKLVAAITTTITLSVTSAYALNIGEVSWKSSYGQPLNARIELSDTKNLQASDINPTIASASDFAKAGLDYSSELSNLVLKTFINANGTGYIEIKSTKPIKEPYLNFLVDVNSASGKVSKEYTILLDVAEPKTTVPPTAKPNIPQPSPLSGDVYKTKRGDSLWSISQQLFEKASASKAAKAIYDKNPDAFINGNANQLLANYSLKLPTDQDVRAISVVQATSFLQTTKGLPTKVDDKQSSPSPSVDPKQTQELKVQLQNSKKELLTVHLENEELNKELGQLQSEIDRLEKVSQQKDSEIAQVKSKVETIQTSPYATNNTAKQNTPEQIKQNNSVTEESTKLTTNQAQSEETTKLTAEKAKQAEIAKLTAEKAKQAETAKLAAEKAKHEEIAKLAAEKAKQAETAKLTAEKAKQAETAKLAAEKAKQEETSPSFLSSLLDNNLLLMFGGGILLILCLVALLLRRRKANDDDATIVDLSNISLDDDDLNSQEIDANAVTSSTSNEKDKKLVSQLGEGMGILDKADIYLAYNHYDEVKELLATAIQEDPVNTDYRLKLMEVYAEQGDTSNFEAEEQELSLIDPLSQYKIDGLKEKYPNLVNDFSFSTPPVSIKEETTTIDVTDPSNTTDVNFEFDTPVINPFEPHQPVDQTIQDNKNPIVPNTVTDADVSFELDKITPDSDNTSPIFESNLDEYDFSSDSTALDFSQEETPLDEVKDNFKFDLGLVDESSTQQTIEPEIITESLSDDIDDVIEKDQVTTKLELVNAYIDMDDTEGAKDLLEEIMREGNTSQQAEAQSLLASITHTDTQSLEEVEPSLEHFIETNISQTDMNNETEISLFDSVDHADTALTELDLGFELPPEDEVSTKLELANAYIEMGDKQGAKDILEEVLGEGTQEQKNKAQELLNAIS